MTDSDIAFWIGLPDDGIVSDDLRADSRHSASGSASPPIDLERLADAIADRVRRTPSARREEPRVIRAFARSRIELIIAGLTNLPIATLSPLPVALPSTDIVRAVWREGLAEALERMTQDGALPAGTTARVARLQERLVDDVIASANRAADDAPSSSSGALATSIAIDDETLAALRETAGEGVVVSVANAPDGHGHVVWFGRAEPWTNDAIGRLASKAADLGIEGSFGMPYSGDAGAALALESARTTNDLRRPDESLVPAVGQPQDAWLQLLAFQRPEALQAFLLNELGALASDGPQATRLRETLTAWFKAGTNIGAGELLGIHEHTVRNRLRRCEELLGHGLMLRRVELEVALHLWRPISGLNDPVDAEE